MTPDVLGRLADANSERDAVHIAIVPMVAAEDLTAGQKVYVVDGEKAVATPPATAIGVVDPFLSAGARKGERFWLCLYPGSITSLRHDWTHPAFTPQESAKASSLKWLEGFAKVIDYELSVFLGKMDEFYCSDRDRFSTYGESMNDLEASWPEICFHYSNISGNKIDPGHYVSFSCSC